MSKCNQCGYCCKVSVIELNLKTDRDQLELMKMKANFIKTVRHAGKLWVVMGGHCIHLQQKELSPGMFNDCHCDKYKNRPKVCRDRPKKNLALWKKIYPECGYCE